MQTTKDDKMAGLALPEMERLLRECHDTTEGAAVRVIVWSLWNDRTAVNLWDRIGDLSRRTRLELATLIEGSIEYREAAIRELLESTGEMDRVDREPLPCRNWERSLFSAPAEKEGGAE